MKRKSKDKKGFTLVEILVAIFLFSIVFLGIFGAFWLGFKVVGLGERKITATQLAQGEIEKIRNLPYLEIGTIGANLPYASGTLEKYEIKVLNGIEYKIERNIKFVSDPADGNDTCPLDYKRAEIKVSFPGILKGEVILVTDISPKDETEELASCVLQPAGILTAQVLNAIGELIFSPKIEIFNPQTGELIDSVNPSSGKYDFLLAPGSYRVIVSKEGYSTERTYSIEEIAIPQKPDPIVLEGQITQISFSIDKISSMQINTLSTWSEQIFSDTFLDESKISEKLNVLVSQGQVTLATTSEGYFSFGYLFSNEISPSNLIEWNEFSFTAEEVPGTDLKYQIFYATATEWILIPDSDLPGNSEGFDQSPINLKNLATTTYSRLKLKATFSTQSPTSTPILKDWQISWKNREAVAIPNVKFDLRGEKIIGKDNQENPIYKFSTTTQTNSQGKIQISNLEWDNYYFSNFQKEYQTLNLATSTPEHPISLAPDTNLKVFLYLEAQNSLLVTVQDSVSLEPIFSATATLSAQNLNQIQYTNEKGQTIFIPLESQNYTLTVEAPGYHSTSTSIFVSGQTSKLIKLERSE